MDQNNEAQELRDHLFSQMKRLSDPSADLDKELKRADALAKVGTVIVNSHKQEIEMRKLEKREQTPKTINLKPAPAPQKKISNGK
jgi:hypothetical protein